MASWKAKDTSRRATARCRRDSATRRKRSRTRSTADRNTLMSIPNGGAAPVFLSRQDRQQYLGPLNVSRRPAFVDDEVEAQRRVRGGRVRFPGNLAQRVRDRRKDHVAFVEAVQLGCDDAVGERKRARENLRTTDDE